MNLTRTTCFVTLAALAGGAFASTGDPKPSELAVTFAAAKPQAGAVLNAATSFIRPKVGLRIGGGQWNEFMLNAGVDVTFKVPILPLPALRFDAEVWGTPSDFGGDRRGNAISLLGIQTFLLGYAGIGPTYYFTDDNGNHRSGLGAKILAGLNLPRSTYVEGGLIVGPSPVPLFITVGMRF